MPAQPHIFNKNNHYRESLPSQGRNQFFRASRSKYGSLSAKSHGCLFVFLGAAGVFSLFNLKLSLSSQFKKYPQSASKDEGWLPPRQLAFEPPHLIGAGLSIKSITGDSGPELLANLQVELPSGSGTCKKRYPDSKIGLAIDDSYATPPLTASVIDDHFKFLKSSSGVSEDKIKDSMGHNRNEVRLLHQIVRVKCSEAISTWGECITAETGFALGTSAVTIMQAHSMASNATQAFAASKSTAGGRSTHYAIDPFQQNVYQNAGARGVANYFSNGGNAMNFYLLNETAALSLAAFTKTRSCIDVIFMDDGHRFEQNIVELSLAIALLPVGGIVVMHDTWMASIKATQSWIETNLDNCLQIVPQKIVKNMLVLFKKAPDGRAWNHFEQFNTNFKND